MLQVSKEIGEGRREMKFSTFFKLKRKECDYSQQDVASCLNISRETVSGWESGRTRPNFEMLRELFLLYECSEEEVLNLMLYQEDIMH